jgi:hypothetical protein
LGVPEAERLAERWHRLIATRMRLGRSPASTAEHVERFHRQHLVAPYPERDARGKVRKARSCPLGAKVQSLIFPLTFSERSARAWALANGFGARKVDVTGSSIRLRQHDPSRFSRFWTVTLDSKKSVRAVMGCVQ